MSALLERVSEARLAAEPRLRYKPLADTTVGGHVRRVYEVRLDGVLLGTVRTGSLMGYPRWISFGTDGREASNTNTRGAAARYLIPTATLLAHDDGEICSTPHPGGNLAELDAWRRGAAEIEARRP